MNILRQARAHKMMVVKSSLPKKLFSRSTTHCSYNLAAIQNYLTRLPAQMHLNAKRKSHRVSLACVLFVIEMHKMMNDSRRSGLDWMLNGCNYVFLFASQNFSSDGWWKIAANALNWAQQARRKLVTLLTLRLMK